MNLITPKLTQSGTSIFSIMSALATEHQAINLSQGFPDFPCDPQLLDLVSHFLKQGKNQYAPMPGIPELRACIAEKTKTLYQANYHQDTEITITSGGTQALYTAITCSLHPGNEVIIFEPAYDSYAPAVELQGAIPVYIHLKFPSFSINWEEVKTKVNSKTRMIILNTPHNPSGTVLTEEDIQQLILLTQNTSILILSDEVYEHLIFDGKKHLSMAGYPELKERSFIIASFGKVLHATGWKLGYCMAPEALMKEFRKVHQFMVFSANTPMQYAIAQYLSDPQTYLSLSLFYQKKRDYFRRLMQETPFDLLPVQGSYFQSAGYSKISDEGDKAFAQRLTKELGVAAIPNSAFYHDHTDHHILRFCFAKKEETLERAVERLSKIPV